MDKLKITEIKIISRRIEEGLKERTRTEKEEIETQWSTIKNGLLTLQEEETGRSENRNKQQSITQNLRDFLENQVN